MTPEQLDEWVAKCRELGLTELEGHDAGGEAFKIRLGEKPPPPRKEQTKEEALKAIEEQRRRHIETQFATCHVVPRLRVLKGG